MINFIQSCYNISTMDTLINGILISNGIYDIICASSILFLFDYPGFRFMATLHPTMFKEEHTQVIV